MVHYKNKKEEILPPYDNDDYDMVIRKIKTFILLSKNNSNMDMEDYGINKNYIEKILFLNKYKDVEIKKWIKRVIQQR